MNVFDTHFISSMHAKPNNIERVRYIRCFIINLTPFLCYKQELKSLIYSDLFIISFIDMFREQNTTIYHKKYNNHGKGNSMAGF